MSESHETDRHRRNPLVRYFATLGPGLVTGASDDDPSGITAYSVAGANGPWLNLLGWSATAVMSLAAISFFASSR